MKRPPFRLPVHYDKVLIYMAILWILTFNFISFNSSSIALSSDVSCTTFGLIAPLEFSIFKFLSHLRFVRSHTVNISLSHPVI